MGLISRIIQRVKLAFATEAAMDLHAELLLRAAARNARLHDQARQYEDAGRNDIGKDIRQLMIRLDQQRSFLDQTDQDDDSQIIELPPDSTPQLPPPRKRK